MENRCLLLFRHHGNTRKVLEAMAREWGEIDLIDATVRQTVRWRTTTASASPPASTLGKFHTSVFTRRPAVSAPWQACVLRLHLRGRHGTEHPGAEGAGGGAGCAVLGTFGCKGYDTFGPFKLVGGLAKGRPDEGDLTAPAAFSGHPDPPEREAA